MSNIKTSKKIILITLGILLVLSLLVGVSYAYYIVTHSQTNSNIVKSTCISLSLTNEQNDISLDKQYPISDEAGASLTPYSFTITNTCRNAISYNLNLEMLEGTTLDSKYVKTMLNDNIVNLATLDATDTSINTSTEAKTLASGILASTKSINYEFRMWMDSNTEADSNSMNKEFLAKIVVTGVPIKSYDFEYTGAVQTFTVPQTGTYKIEVWGASGYDKQCGNYNATECNMPDVLKDSYGLGAYVSGILNVSKDNILYVYVGGNNFYNGGGRGEARGGGATDIRMVKDSLNSRIMVAGGGGGGMYARNASIVSIGNAGGLTGYDADAIITSSSNGQTRNFSGHGGTQYSGGKAGIYGYYEYSEVMDGSFGQGGEGPKGDASSGGGGWYGGGQGRHTGGTWPGGGGGSSYISGHPGCLAVSSSTSTNLKNGCTENSTSLECSISYTGYYFTDTVMIDGAGYKWTTEKGAYTGMPSHDGTGTITGNLGNGYARITYIG